MTGVQTCALPIFGVSLVAKLNPEVLRYVNRLSDLLYVLARQANKELEVKEQQPIYKYFEGKSEEKK